MIKKFHNEFSVKTIYHKYCLRISVYTLNNPIHSNKYCSFRQQSLRLLAMLRLRDLFCFSMFSIHCLMTAKFSQRSPLWPELILSERNI